MNNRLFSRNDLVRLIIPLIVDQFLQVAVGLSDSIMVARVGEAAVSGVSLVDTVMLLIINIFTALATGGAVIAGQYLGRKDPKTGCEATAQLFNFTFLFSIFIMILGYLGQNVILYHVFGKIEPEVMKTVQDRLAERYAEIAKNETQVEEYRMEDAEYCIAAYGTTARIAKSMIAKARDMGIKVGLIRPKTVWPFPSEAYAKAADKVKAFLGFEMSMGQMVEDVRLAANGVCPVGFYGRTGGIVPTPAEVLAEIEKMAGGAR